MREIPILFSTPMVQAILDGRKTMTRRICKDIAGYDFKWGLDEEPYIGNYKIFAKTESGKWDWVTLENQWLYDLQTAVDDNRTHLLKCPYGQPGDRLWVREKTYRIPWPDGIDGIAYAADDEPVWDITRPCRWVWQKNVLPSIHMPRSVARLFLRVKSVRVERLQDINYFGCIEEGLPYKQFEKDIVGDFAVLWDSIYAKRGFGWDVDPWVWVLEFERT